LNLTIKKRTRGKGVKPAMIHINMRLPKHVVEHFKELPNYTTEIRKVLVEYVNKLDNEGATQVTLDQQRWQDVLAEENEDE
jgi:hypothetical protein